MISKESKGSWPGFWAPAGDRGNSWKQKGQGEEQVGVQGEERKHSHMTVTCHWHVAGDWNHRKGCAQSKS